MSHKYRHNRKLILCVYSQETLIFLTVSCSFQSIWTRPIQEMSPIAASFVSALTCIAIDAFELQEKSDVDVCQKRSNSRLLAWEKCHDIGDSLTNPMQSQKGILSTAVMLRRCQKQWPFQLDAENNQTPVLCIKCRPDVPVPMAIDRHKKTRDLVV